MLNKVLARLAAAARGWRSALARRIIPTRPITMVIPFAAGGPTDVLGRVVGAAHGRNARPAGGGRERRRRRRHDRLASASPIARPTATTSCSARVGTHAQGQTLYKKPLYNSQTDFTPVGLIAEVPIALIARKDLPVKNLKEFVAYAKANQAKMQFGSAGAGSATHLGCVLLNYMIGVNITHVPYRGTGPAMQDLHRRPHRLSSARSSPRLKPQIDGGTVKALAIMLDSKRSPALPNLPTAEEQGTKDLIAYTWNAIFLPKGAPERDREEAQRRHAGRRCTRRR